MGAGVQNVQNGWLAPSKLLKVKDKFCLMTFFRLYYPTGSRLTSKLFAGLFKMMLQLKVVNEGKEEGSRQGRQGERNRTTTTSSSFPAAALSISVQQICESRETGELRVITVPVHACP